MTHIPRPMDSISTQNRTRPSTQAHATDDRREHYQVTFRFIFTLEEDLSINLGVDDVLPHTTHHCRWLSPVLLANDLRILASIQSVAHHYQSPKEGWGSGSVIKDTRFKGGLLCRHLGGDKNTHQSAPHPCHRAHHWSK